MILCGNQSPSWTAEDVVNYTEPKLGYTRDRYELGKLSWPWMKFPQGQMELDRVNIKHVAC